MNMRIILKNIFFLCLIGMITIPAQSQAPQNLNNNTFEIVSVSSDGTRGNHNSEDVVISPDGRYVAFESMASNLVPNDTNGARDIFFHDRQTGQTEIISNAYDGSPGNGQSWIHEDDNQAISSDGRYIVFYSADPNLVPNDTNGNIDTFVHDRQTGQNELISVASDGSSCPFYPVISANGRYVACSGVSNPNYYSDVIVYDLQTKQTEVPSLAYDGSWGTATASEPSISADGRYVAFRSGRLLPDDTVGHVYVRDRQTGQLERVSVASDGSQPNRGAANPVISANGQFVAFLSWASDLVPETTNFTQSLYVHNRQTKQTELVSISYDGSQGNDIASSHRISADGRYITFQSSATNLVPDNLGGGVYNFVRDLQTGTTTRLIVPNNQSLGSTLTISADGTYLAFQSFPSRLIPGDNDRLIQVFVYDWQGIFNNNDDWEIFLPIIIK
ncbi:MAG: hypothetical protein DWQ04_26615 [Chloroflexi bacterium]|nr:MAG: hypothetical protein DWQ04_26615 [Chloroflexota bacterium]